MILILNSAIAERVSQLLRRQPVIRSSILLKHIADLEGRVDVQSVRVPVPARTGPRKKPDDPHAATPRPSPP